MFPRYGSYPGFHPMVELSMTFHTQVVGANGQRQAMFIERVPGLAEVILSNFTFGASDVMMVFSASGSTAVPVEMAAARVRAACAVIAVTSVAQSMSVEPGPEVGARLLDEADLVIDLCTPPGDAMVHVDGLDTPVGPGSTITNVAIVNSIKMRVAQLLTERGAMPPVITRASEVGDRALRELFEAAYDEHARRIARAIDKPLARRCVRPTDVRLPRSWSRPAAGPSPAPGAQRRNRQEWIDPARKLLAGARLSRSLAAAVAGLPRRQSPAASGAQPATYTIGFSNPGGVGNGWREEMICSAKAQALASGRSVGINIIHRDTDAAGQLEDIRDLISAGVDAIIVNPATSSALNPAIQQASDPGIVGRRGRRPGHRARRL